MTEAILIVVMLKLIIQVLVSIYAIIDTDDFILFTPYDDALFIRTTSLINLIVYSYLIYNINTLLSK